MLLSVIIPVYNVKPYIEQCVLSVIKQTYEELQIIIVDDGSTDGSQKLVDQLSLQDSRIEVIHKENGGLLSARIAGVNIANGEYIVFLDGDDWIHPAMYENLMSKILETDTDIITSGCYRVYENNMVESYDFKIPEGLYNKEQLERDIYPVMMYDKTLGTYALDPSTCFKIYKRDLLLPILHKLQICNFYYAEDSAISFLYMLNANNMICTHEKYYYHRQRPSNTLPSYWTDDYFLSKLFQFYEFMSKEMKNGKYWNIMNVQLDLFFARAANLVRLKYGLPVNQRSTYFLFPFDLVAPASRIILYGAGNVGQDYEKQLNKFHRWKLVAWVDRNFESLNENIQNPEIIKEVEFDYIVIAIANDEVSTSVKMWLLEQGVPENKVIHKISRCSV